MKTGISYKFLMPSCVVVVWLVSVIACQSSVPEFDEQRAFQYLQDQCALGPRNPGSNGHTAALDYFTRELQGFADTVFQQPFTAEDPATGNSYALNNIVARFQSSLDTGTHILLGAHWDTRPRADMDRDPARRDDPILGANDGASGAAVLLELARLFFQNPPPVSVTLVFFDGEDMGLNGKPESWALGSQYFARNLPIPKPEAAIVIDMIGDADLSLPIERNSYIYHPQLVKTLWNLARELDLPAFKQEMQDMVYDDHMPLIQEAGIPAVDIIDFRYPNRYSNYWHTHQDLPENCSPESLDQVGTLLLHYLYTLEQNN